MYVPDRKIIGTDFGVITATIGEGEATVLITIDTLRLEEMSTGGHLRRPHYHDTSPMNVLRRGVAIVNARLQLNMFPCEL